MIKSSDIRPGALIAVKNPITGDAPKLYIVAIEDGRVTFARKPGGRPHWWLRYQFLKEHGIRSVE